MGRLKSHFLEEVSYKDFLYGLSDIVYDLTTKYKINTTSNIKLVLYFPYINCLKYKPEFFLIIDDKKEDNFIKCISRIGGTSTFQTFLLHPSNVTSKNDKLKIYECFPINIKDNLYRSPLIPIECPESSVLTKDIKKLFSSNKYVNNIISNDFSYIKKNF